MLHCVVMGHSHGATLYLIMNLQIACDGDNRTLYSNQIPLVSIPLATCSVTPLYLALPPPSITLLLLWPRTSRPRAAHSLIFPMRIPMVRDERRRLAPPRPAAPCVPPPPAHVLAAPRHRRAAGRSAGQKNWTTWGWGDGSSRCVETAAVPRDRSIPPTLSPPIGGFVGCSRGTADSTIVVIAAS
jgi:hypothetical protein